MKKFWTVRYAVIGSGMVWDAWFDDKKEAEAFAEKDYRDNPVLHCYRSEKSIKKAEELVAARKEAEEY